MAVSETFTADTMRRVGFGPVTQDPRIPAGMWFRQDSATGDASGGTVTLTQILDEAYLYSLESIHSFVSQVLAVTEFELQWAPTLPLIEGGTRGFFPIGLEQNIVTGISQAGIPNKLNLPISLQAIQVGAPFTTSIFHENVNGEFYRITQWGYFWQPSALKMPGGPQRPV